MKLEGRKLQCITMQSQTELCNYLNSRYDIDIISIVTLKDGNLCAFYTERKVYE